ncbi:carbohydrate kinase [Saccharata proteae CBS 121410]|uniref:Gluconokinase n=1 Tax=Saccharata proteae CBS 121410 TaxID=1314787 RepID=A0A6A5YDC2_9PEZI|nr:carbohydrate kinase [Saccharata proteae CBS 121410]
MLTYNTSSSLHGSAPNPSSMAPTILTNSMPLPPHHRHIWIVTGPAGCGKSTVAKFIAEQLNTPYIEGDEFHPKSNIDKMAAGIPLTDADRWDWLILLRQQAVQELSNGFSDVVLTCSALKKKYRDVIRIASYNDQNVLVHFVYLKASEAVLMERVRSRPGHFMKDNMVRSQFQSLEEPDEEETDKDVIEVDVSGDLAEVQTLALNMVQQVLDKDHAGPSS